MIVILCDGSSKGNPGPASVGVVVWDRSDNPRRIMPTHHWHEDIGKKTNMEAEWEALLSALSWMFARNNKDDKVSFVYPSQEVFIFSDSQTVVKQATGVWKIKHENIKPLYEKFKVFMEGRKNIHINWVPRQLIYLADKAAQKGVK